jgi:hypothetical protein
MLFVYNPFGITTGKPLSARYYPMAVLRRIVAVCICMCCLLPVCIGGNSEALSVAHIDKQLLAGADLVVREYTVDMQITPAGEVLVKKNIVLTVLSEKGLQYASFGEDFSKLKKIQKIEGAVYDRDGGLITRVRSSDFINTSLNPETGAYSDDKIMFFMCPKKALPFTVSYTVETKQNHTFLIPDFFPEHNEGCAIEHAALTVAVPADQQLRYKAVHTDVVPGKKTGNGQTIYSWVFGKMPAANAEPFCSNGYYDHPGILLAMAHLRLGDYEGKANDWRELGAFIYELNEGRDILPEAEKQKIKNLVAGMTNPYEKVQQLYKYLQDNFRYVAVEYGIGGWQTLDAAFLTKNRYGDCKALTNYMMAMLEAVDVPAYPVLINAGAKNNAIFPTDFAVPHFNHMILCAPVGKDSVWLECTSNDLPAGYLSDFTQNRSGLMITPAGGQLVRTPAYDTAVNKVYRHAVVQLLPEGKLRVVLNIDHYGQPAVVLHHQVSNKSAHDLDMLLEEKFSLPGYTVTGYNYKRNDGKALMGLHEHIEMDVASMTTTAGERILVNLDVAPLNIPLPVSLTERRQPFYLPETYACNDSFEYAIPSGLAVEDLPAPVALSFPFGSYRCSVTNVNGRLVVKRSFTQNSGMYNAALYGDYEMFAEKILQGKQLKVALK